MRVEMKTGIDDSNEDDFEEEVMMMMAIKMQGE